MIWTIRECIIIQVSQICILAGTQLLEICELHELLTFSVFFIHCPVQKFLQFIFNLMNKNTLHYLIVYNSNRYYEFWWVNWQKIGVKMIPFWKTVPFFNEKIIGGYNFGYWEKNRATIWDKTKIAPSKSSHFITVLYSVLIPKSICQDNVGWKEVHFWSRFFQYRTTK